MTSLRARFQTGTTDLCFNLQAFAGLTSAEFSERRILHLEGANWTTNQTISWNFATKTICARVPSLSPFAIVDSNLPPTAASVSIGGRVRSANGKEIALARVSLTDASGNTRATLTNLFGKYRFDDVPAGATYIISASHRQIQFAQNTQVRFIGEDEFRIDFVAIE